MTPAEIVRTTYAALDANDFPTLLAHIDPDVVLHIPGSHPLAGRHEGLAGFAGFLEKTRALTQGGETIRLLDVMGGDSHVAAYCRVTAEREGRVPLDNTTVHLTRIEGGRIKEIWFHNWDNAAASAFWR
jgi:ketosteroid isomerase-like protein